MKTRRQFAMAGTPGIGDLMSTAPATPGPAQPETPFVQFWAKYGDAIGAITSIVFLLMALPGRNQRA